MKTPIQEAIDNINKMEGVHKISSINALILVEDMLKQLLELEKSLIKKSFVDGVVSAKISHIKLQTAEDYYNDKYGKNV